MIKIFFLTAILLSSLSATDFKAFLEKALTDSPYLKASSSNIDRARYEGAIEQRYKNPTLELEASSFDEAGIKDNGYRASWVQPIRLWGVGDAKKGYADAILKEAEATHTMQKAEFIRNLSLLYTEYARSKKYKDLATEEIRLAKKIHTISNERFNAGTISRGKLLQAKIAFESAQNRYEQLDLQAHQDYIQLLKMAGINEDVKLSTTHMFQLNNTETTSSPEQVLWQRRVEKTQAIAKVKENSVEWIDLFAEYEKEPLQDINRVGVSIPLMLFNDKSEERQIAKLNAYNTELMMEQSTNQQNMEQRRLKQEIAYLERLQQSRQKILRTELELLGMFEESYKISKINLLELQNIKNKVIATKKELIDLSTNLQSNIINLNYLQGTYNE